MDDSDDEGGDNMINDILGLGDSNQEIEEKGIEQEVPGTKDLRDTRET